MVGFVNGLSLDLSPSTLSMEHVRMRDNWSPPPTADSTTPFNQTDPFLLTPNRREFDTVHPTRHSPSPSTASFEYPDPKSPSSSRRPIYLKFELPRSKPLFKGFEGPSWTHIIILTVLCLTSYPALYVLTLVASVKSLKSLFIVRLIVATWCSGVGFALGYILLKIGAQHLEAASESTVTLVRYRGFLTLCFK